ncbi:MAG: hypothetical protein CL663_06395 [Bacteroidetes bacterium]|nr:hypothetical protein [Bacteroidota bacterium]|tara:strand:- start:313 stop:756 length:444 start_codon:yes stop_codon:yes gene_type:complete
MNCKEIHNKLNAYLESSLDDDQLRDFNMHLDACDTCKKVVSEMELTMQILDRPVKLEADPFMHTRIIAELENESETVKWKFKQVLQPVLLGMIILVGVYLGIGLGNRFYDEDVFSNQQDSEVNLIDLEIDTYANITSDIETFLLSEE